MVVVREGTVVPDYFQFYLQGRGDAFDDLGGDVSDAQMESHLVGTGDGATVHTFGQYGPTPIRVEAWSEAPADMIDDRWEHVVEASFETDGLLRVVSWPDEVALEVPLENGVVRARVHWGGLTEDANRLHSDADDVTEVRSEHLLVQVWPAPDGEEQVLRWWPGWVLPPPSTATPAGRRQLEGDEKVVATYGRFLRLPVQLSHHDESHPPAEFGLRSALRVVYDPDEEMWWLEGYHHRSALVELTESEARDLLSRGMPLLARLVIRDEATVLEMPNFSGESDLQVVSAASVEALRRVGLEWAPVAADAVPPNEPTWDGALQVLGALVGKSLPPEALDLARRLRGRWERELALWVFPSGVNLRPRGGTHRARFRLHIDWQAEDCVVTTLVSRRRQPEERQETEVRRTDLERVVNDSLQRLVSG